MKGKTKVQADAGKQDILITRTFELPIELLFRAYVEPELLEQWMGTKVIKLENRKHGGWEFKTSDENGTVLFQANGVIHDVVPNSKIIRTFEMTNAGFEPQLEFLDFEALTENTSRLTIQIVFRSVDARDNQLKLPFEYGINMAHNTLEEIAKKLL